MHRLAWLVPLLSIPLALAACGSTPTEAERPPGGGAHSEAPPDDLPPELDLTPDETGVARLDDAVVPLAVDLTLRIDPASPTFSGRETIKIQVDGDRRALVLHATDAVTIGDARLDDRPAHVERLDAERIVVRPDEGYVTDGAHALAITFEAPLETSMMGLYRVEVDGRWYAFTQMEPISARSAFPAFDEPRFKAPWSVVIEAPDGLVAAANGPLVTSEPTETPGWTRHTFAETKPIPSYLFAAAVGPFDVVEAPADALPGGVPFRILTVQGAGDRVGYPLEHTGEVLGALAAYFGEPYPYAKLDFVAVPNFSAGAMENPGLVTYRETLLMVSADDPPDTRRRSLGVIGHELAHMWFGNLVSPAWWDEIWLNEAFATWMGNRVLDEVMPELEAHLGLTSWMGYVMSGDAQLSSRAVRQPILSQGDIHNAFDGITYGKGAAVLRMIEQWTGPDAFRDAVRDYMAAHRWGAARTDDLLAAFEANTDLPVRDVLSSFVDQPGVPLVELSWTCDPAAPSLSVDIQQRRFLVGDAKSAESQVWSVPVCLSAPEGTFPDDAAACTLLTQSSTTLELAVTSCPAWLYPNTNAVGYYRWQIPGDQLVTMLEAHRNELTIGEQAALGAQLTALLESGQLDVPTWIRGLEALGGSQHRYVVGGLLNGIGLLHERLVPDPMQPALASWTRQVLGPQLERLGAEPRQDEPVNDRLLRPRVLSTMAEVGKDEALLAVAAERTDAFLADPSSVPLDLAGPAVALTARDADAALWQRLRDTLDDPSLDPKVRGVVLSGLGAVRDPALLERSLALVLDGTVRSQDVGRILYGGLGTDATAAIVWTWLVANYDALRELLGDERSAGLPGLASRFCTRDRHDEVEAFFSQPEHLPPGTERRREQVLESMRRCITLRAATEAGIATVFGAN